MPLWPLSLPGTTLRSLTPGTPSRSVVIQGLNIHFKELSLKDDKINKDKNGKELVSSGS